MLNHKMDNSKDTGAGIVACACSGCMVQLQGGIDQQAQEKKMKHVAGILAENIRD